MSTEPTPITDIVDAGNPQGRPAETVGPQTEDQAPQTTRDQAGDDSADRTPGSWTYAAFKQERTKRQALAQRVRELEDENQALLTSKEEPVANTEGGFWANPEAALTRVQQRANQRASKAEFIASYGRDEYAALDEAIGRAMQANHPDLPAVRDAMLASDDPIGVAMQWAQQAGVLDQRPAQSRPAQVFPSNLAGARNVGRRSGPAWTGPTPLADIFKR
jgi:hypothetical protein